MMPLPETPQPSAAAADYIARGWSPIPVKRGSKAPHGKAWQAQRLGTNDLERFGPSDNVGVLLGEPSAWLVDVDLDAPEALTLADEILPPTGAVFGRASKPASHRLYVSEGAEYGKYTYDGVTLAELRSTGQQTIFPGSVHPGGETIAWGDYNEPLRVGAAELSRAVARLAVATLLVRRGADRGAAVRMAQDDAALLEINDNSGSLVRAWLGLAPKPKQQPKARGADFAEAVFRYNQERSREWPKACGDCPGCGHRGCFGGLPGTSRWYCFSASHAAPGLAGKFGYHGDALDLDAHAAGLKPAELLRREGYLPERHLRPVEPRGGGGGGGGGAPVVHDPREIVVGTDAERVVDEALEALGESGSEVYHRGGFLVQVVSDAARVAGIEYQRGTPRLVPVGQARLLELMASSARWQKIETRGRPGADGAGREPRSCLPPGWAVKAVAERGSWPQLRRVASVVEVPVVRPDGSVLSVPGYDDATGLIYKPSAPVDVPGAPTKLDAELARDVLLSAVCDFPFASPVHKAAWFALVLTPFARFAFEGPAPLSLIDANTRGSGKSLLADVACYAATGQPAPRTAGAEDDAEERKRLTALALSGDRFVLIDNVTKLGTPALDAALTSVRWRDRLLGSTATFDGELRAVFTATGNNVELGADLSRRVLHIRLESAHENPEHRSDFQHPELLGWLRSSWPSLASAAVTVLRAFCLAGRPAQDVQRWGSFEGWNQLVAQATVWVGLEDPNKSRQELQEQADQGARALKAFLRAFKTYAGLGATVRDFLADLTRYPDTHRDARGALLEWCPNRKDELPSPITVGKKLAAAKGRNAGGLCAVVVGEDRTGAIIWAVREVAP